MGAVAEYARELQAVPVEITPDTVLAGADGIFDSMALVGVVLEIEQRVTDRIGRAVSLVDERAMSQQRSPFRTVRSITSYLVTLLAASPR